LKSWNENTLKRISFTFHLFGLKYVLEKAIIYLYILNLSLFDGQKLFISFEYRFNAFIFSQKLLQSYIT